MIIAERLGARHVVKLSEVGHVYSADPRVDPGARAFDHLSWVELQGLTGEHWSPGYSAPFDPIATTRAGDLGLTLVVTGSDLTNLHRILDGASYAGTTVGPE